MLVKCSKAMSSIVKRTLDMVIEGSERGIISFTATGMEIQSVDATMSCVCTCTFAASSFTIFELETEMLVRIHIRELREFIRLSKYESFDFVKADDDMYINVVSYPSLDSQLLVDNGDMTAYFNIRPAMYTHQPSFTISQEEYNSIIYHLCVGGGTTNFTMQRNTVILTAESENCRVNYVITDDNNSDGFCIIRSPAKNTIVRCTYLTKFLKQICCIVSSCSNITVHVDNDKPITIVMLMEDNSSKIVIAIVPINNSHRREGPGAVQ